MSYEINRFADKWVLTRYVTNEGRFEKRTVLVDVNDTIEITVDGIRVKHSEEGFPDER